MGCYLLIDAVFARAGIGLADATLLYSTLLDSLFCPLLQVLGFLALVVVQLVFHIIRVATIEADAAGFDFFESRKK
jgi:hypothetical protein